MNSEIKAKWVNALRSGKYAQTNGKLQSTEGFCCLGVLCDLYTKENDNIDIHWELTSDCEYFIGGRSDFLPFAVREWAGLENENPYVELPVDEEDLDANYSDDGPVTCPIELSELNDQGNTFNEIADLIQTQL